MSPQTQTSPFTNRQDDEDLHELMAVAVLCGHHGLRQDVSAIYDAWARAYPDDALGGIGQGLAMIGSGAPKEGYRLIEETARTAATRAEQARDVLATLKREISTLAAE